MDYSKITATEETKHEASKKSHPQETTTKDEEDAKKWGTHVMGQPAAPASHPDNQKAATWNAAAYQQPYVEFAQVQKPSHSPLESVLQAFNSWTSKADNIAANIWQNLRTGHSVSDAAWGKIKLTAKAMSEGGFETLFKHTFATEINEKLKKSFACYLSTTTGPVAGTLYLSTHRVAFCSDRPLCFPAPSGQQTWSYYKVSIPLGNISSVNPVVMKEDPPEKYIEIETVDGHEFWFMGFVSYEKATHHLISSVSEFSAQGVVATGGGPATATV
ncbi:hypothetical protein ACFE04_024598 [Oxalis oulophora]